MIDTPLTVSLIPAGEVRTADDVARVLEEVARRLDCYSALADVELPPPAMHSLECAYLLRALAAYVRLPEPFAWERETTQGEEVLALILRAIPRMAQSPEGVVGLHVQSLAVLVADLPSSCPGVATVAVDADEE